MQVIKLDFSICGKNVNTSFVWEPRLFDDRDEGILEGLNYGRDNVLS